MHDWLIHHKWLSDDAISPTNKQEIIDILIGKYRKYLPLNTPLEISLGYKTINKTLYHGYFKFYIDNKKQYSWKRIKKRVNKK